MLGANGAAGFSMGIAKVVFVILFVVSVVFGFVLNI
jgi:uncharacterized membrane protein YtjA (UPF0391 family)